jgi:hypothetical protein
MTTGKANLIVLSSSTLRADEGYLTHLWHCMGLENGGYRRVRSGYASDVAKQSLVIARVVEGANRNPQWLRP